jgi:hypothetical protein
MVLAVALFSGISCKEEQKKVEANEIIVPGKTSNERLMMSKLIDSSRLIPLETDSVVQYAFDLGNKDTGLSELKPAKIKIASFTQNPKYALFYYIGNLDNPYQPEYAISIFDKESHIVKSYFVHNLYDEHLGNYPLWFTYTTDSDEFVAQVEPAHLFENPTDKTKDLIKKLNLLEDDNPILYVVKMK